MNVLLEKGKCAAPSTFTMAMSRLHRRGQTSVHTAKSLAGVNKSPRVEPESCGEKQKL